METVRIIIELDYDLDSHYGELGRQKEEYSKLPMETIVNDLEDTVYEDLIDLMRNDRLRFWADTKVLA
jgi:hypothetical protein